MGVKRISRGKLFDTEKQGIDVSDTIGISAVMKKALVSATQHREGHKVITDIVLDLGASAAGLKTQSIGTAGNGSDASKSLSIGTTTNAADTTFICRTAQSVFGAITSVETICLEAFLDSGTITDLDLVYGADGDGRLANADGTPSEFDAGTGSGKLNNIGAAVGKHETVTLDANELAAGSGRYIYFAMGTNATQKATATIDCSNSTPANVTAGALSFAIRLTDDDGTTKIVFQPDTGNNFDSGTESANEFNIGNIGTTKASLAEGISRGIANNGNFTTNLSSEEVTVTANAVLATSYSTGNSIIEDASLPSGVTITDFSGGAPYSISTGKFLIRFTGFLAPDDL